MFVDPNDVTTLEALFAKKAKMRPNGILLEGLLSKYDVQRIETALDTVLAMGHPMGQDQLIVFIETYLTHPPMFNRGIETVKEQVDPNKNTVETPDSKFGYTAEQMARLSAMKEKEDRAKNLQVGQVRDHKLPQQVEIPKTEQPIAQDGVYIPRVLPNRSIHDDGYAQGYKDGYTDGAAAAYSDVHRYIERRLKGN